MTPGVSVSICVCVCEEIVMRPHSAHREAINPGMILPTYVSRPYNATTSVVQSYRGLQSLIVGWLLVTTGLLSVAFNIVDLAVGSRTTYQHREPDYQYTLSSMSNGIVGHGLWCGAVVSIVLDCLR